MRAARQNAKAIFSEALERGGDEARAAYLDEACNGDPALRVKVEGLLTAYAKAGEFLQTPPFVVDTGLDEIPRAEAPGIMIDRYKLLEKIGEGGMAAVYVAEQETPVRRKVALKIIKLGMDTKQVIARFEGERQALAIMDHSNIAKVFDAGATEAGRPYFVMELVTGVSITEYCDANHLNTKERLTLFMQVCNAIQHAHQKGIIHRDIKPSNVMVTTHDGKPVSKVIDFGIAKAVNQRLTEKTLFTRHAQIIGTPAYMSPEQAGLSDVDVDTRSDIYSLGVLLYELLTGAPPFSEQDLREAGYLEMQRVIREEEPTKPSTKLSTLGDSLSDIAKRRSCSPDLLRRTLRGDLDWIVMKSLEKDRTRRYGATSALLGDIERYLRREPVSAGPPNPWYRAKKFIVRHAKLVAMLVAMASVVVVGFIISSTMYLRAEQAREKESAARVEAQTTIDFLTDDLLASVYPEKAKRPNVTVRYILENASKDLDTKFERQPLAEAAIRETLGLTYQKLGDYNGAAPHLRHVLEIRRAQLGDDDPATLTALNNLGWLYWYQGRYDEAEPLLVEALETRTRVLGEAHPDTLQSMSNLGWLYGMRRIEGQIGKAWELHQKVLEIGIPVLGEEHPVILQSMCDLAFEYTTTGRLDKAEALATKGLEISRLVLGNEHEATLYYMSTLAWVYGHEKRYDEAAALALEAFETSREVVGEEHLASIWAQSILGWIYLEQGRYDEAETPLTQSVAISERVFGDTHALTQFFRSRATGLYRRTERYEELDELLVHAYEVGRQVHGKMHLHTRLFRQNLIARLPELGLLGQDQYENKQYQDTLTTFYHIGDIRRVLGFEPVPTERAVVAMSLCQLGRGQEAREALSQVRLLCATGDYAYNESSLYEAERLLVGHDRALSEAWGAIEAGQLDNAQEILESIRKDYQGDGSYPLDNFQSCAQALARCFYVRAEEAEARKMYEKARGLYESALQADSGQAWLLNRFAWLLATCPSAPIRDGRKAVQLATQACELTTWKDADCLNVLAAACAETANFLAAGRWQNTAIGLLPQDVRSCLRADYTKRLRLYEAKEPYHRKNALPMVAWWRLDRAVDGHILDASGNGLDGELVGDAKIVFDAERGNVLSLEGHGYVDCGDDVAFDITGPITIAAWVKVHTFDVGLQAIVTKGDNAWMLDRYDGFDSVRLVCGGTTVANHGWGMVPGRKSVNDARWHHIVGVYDRTRMCLYVDGELDVSTPAYGKTAINDRAVFIGANANTSGRDWKGLIDDVRLYDYALGEAEVRALYNGEEAKASLE